MPGGFYENMYSQQDAGPSKRMWLGENRRTSGLFPEEKGAIAHMSPHAHIQGQGSRDVSCDVALRSQSPGHQDGAETRQWQSWSRRPYGERGARVKKVSLE